MFRSWDHHQGAVSSLLKLHYKNDTDFAVPVGYCGSMPCCVLLFYSVTLARTIRLPDDGPRTETCRSVFNVLMCKFYKLYICAVVGIIIE